jgi:hypothetical protein
MLTTRHTRCLACLVALEIQQREPAGTEYGDVNESAGYCDVADESIFQDRAHFQRPLEGPELHKDERDENGE